MARARQVPLLAIFATAALLGSGCGSASLHVGGGTSSSSSGRASTNGSPGQPGSGGASSGSSPHATPGPVPTAPTHRSADASSVKVIEGWSSALRHGDIRTAALYFKIPSLFASGPGAVLAIRDLRQAEAANQALPCGAKFISADQRGRYVNALFKLTGRSGPGGGSCGTGVGLTARTDFLIENGRILEWIRAPDDPGDNRLPGKSGPPTPKAPTTPTTPTTPGAAPLV